MYTIHTDDSGIFYERARTLFEAAKEELLIARIRHHVRKTLIQSIHDTWMPNNLEDTYWEKYKNDDDFFVSQWKVICDPFKDDQASRSEFIAKERVETARKIAFRSGVGSTDFYNGYTYDARGDVAKGHSSPHPDYFSLSSFFRETRGAIFYNNLYIAGLDKFIERMRQEWSPSEPASETDKKNKSSDIAMDAHKTEILERMLSNQGLVERFRASLYTVMSKPEKTF